MYIKKFLYERVRSSTIVRLIGEHDLSLFVATSNVNDVDISVPTKPVLLLFGSKFQANFSAFVIDRGRNCWKLSKLLSVKKFHQILSQTQSLEV